MRASVPGLGLRAGIVVCVHLTAAAVPAQTTSIVVDGTKGGRVFDGIGAISGGGGNSRLLVDYPEPQRSQILDYLFKPGYGAALQILKVEVGGDANSTDGAEPSHKHTRNDLDCNRGYEWWLMEQAKARNPSIKLAALAWAAPGWVGGRSFWSQDMVDYYVSWLECAESHGLTIDYLGGWNERGHDKAWYESLHATLAARGYATKVVADDMVGWQVADDMAADAAFKAAVDVIGGHYNCGYTSSSAGIQCKGTVGGKTIDITANALDSGRPIWNSETGSQDYQTGAIPMSRVYVRGYLDSRMTGYLNWPVIAALTPNLAYGTAGLMLARQPWSGSYTVGRALWATAHHTQFTAPGWRYVDTASGFLGGSRASGSYVTRKAPNGIDYSVVIETLDATAAQTASFTITGGLSTGTVRVWSSDFKGTDPAGYFVRQPDVLPSAGTFALTLLPGRVYSLTTTSGQGKGTAVPPAGHAMALPYADDFEGYAVGREARYLADMDGAFEIVGCGAGRAGKCVRQMAETAPIAWGTLSDPSALLGDTGWTNYTVSVDAMMPSSGYVELQGRVGSQSPHAPAKVNAYFVRIGSSGAWSILKSDKTPTLTTLASGTTAAPGTGTWHRLSATFNGATLTARLDSVTLGSASDGSYAAGQIGIAASKWIPAQFDNLSISGIGGSTPTPTPTPTPTASPTPDGAFLEITPPASAVTASTHDGNLPGNTVDGSLASRWSANGDGQWIAFDLGGSRTLAYVKLAFYSGNARQSRFDLQVSDDGATWTNVLTGALSGGTTTLEETFDFAERVARHLRYLGHGNSVNAWNSLTEVSVFSPSEAPVPTPTPTPTPGGGSAGYYKLIARHSGKAVVVAGASTADGADVVQWTYGGAAANDEWLLSDLGNSYYRILNRTSGKALNVKGASTVNGADVIQWPAGGATTLNDQWQPADLGNGYHRILNRTSGKVLNVSGASTADGANVDQWSWANVNQQMFELVPVP